MASFQLVVAEHTAPTFDLMKEGALFNSASSFMRGDGCDILQGWDGEDEDLDNSTVFTYGIDQDGTTTNRIQRDRNLRADTHNFEYTHNNKANTRNSKGNNGLRTVSLLNRAGNDRLQHHHLDRSAPLVNATNQDLDDSDKQAIGFDGFNWIVGDDAGGTTITFQEWYSEAGSNSITRVRDLPSGTAKGRGFVFDGFTLITVRDITGGYRIVLNDRSIGQNYKNVAQRTPSGFLTVEDVAWDGINLWIMWISDGTGVLPDLP